MTTLSCFIALNMHFFLYCYKYSVFSFLCQPSDPNYAGQEAVYNDIGKEMLKHAFEG